jgi:hypothetical protein
MIDFRHGAVLIALPLLLLGACSSGNPDALNSVNLGDNVAAADSNSADDTSAAEATPPTAETATSARATASENSTNSIDEAVNGLAEMDAQEEAAEPAATGQNRDDENNNSDEPHD